MPRTEVSGSQIKDSSVALSAAASPTGVADVTGVLPVGNGGTGATTLTGLVKGNGGSAMTVAVAGTDYSTPNGTETLTNKTLTNPTLTTPIINGLPTGTPQVLTLNRSVDAFLAVENGSSKVIVGATGFDAFVGTQNSINLNFRTGNITRATLTTAGDFNTVGAITANSVPVVTTTGVQSLTNKTLTSPTLATPSVSGSTATPAIISASGADANIGIVLNSKGASNIEFQRDGVATVRFIPSGGASPIEFWSESSVVSMESSGGNRNLNLVASGTGNVRANGVPVVTTTGTQALTNKNLTGAGNTFPTFNQSTTGNAATATTLQTARTINGVSFNGSANITIADATKEPTITAGTTAQYYRGDKTFQTLNATAVGLGSVNNTSDAAKPVSTATQTALNLKQDASQKGQANGYASLDSGGKVPVAQLPNSIMEYQGTWNASTNTPALANGTGNTGDVYRVSVAGSALSLTFDVGDYVIYNGSTWEKSDTTDAVATVAGRTGNVVLTKSDVGLANVDNTADASKSVASAATLTTARTINGVSFNGSANITVADATKEPTITAGTTAQYYRGDKTFQTLNATAVGLGNVTNVAASTTATASSIAQRDANKNLLADNFLATATSTATAAGITTLTIAATAIQIFTGTTTQTLRLPTTSVLAGQAYTVINNSTGTVTVQSSAGNTITVQAAGRVGVYTAMANTPTTDVHWVGTTLAAGKVFKAINDLTLQGTDGTTFTFPTANGTVLTADSTATLTNKNLTGAGNTFPTFNQNTTGSAATLTTARTIGGVSFNGSANINLPGVNTAGTQNTTGSAATLTTARTIGGVSFNGSANINLPGVNTAGNQNTTGSAATLTTGRTVTTNLASTAAATFNGSANITPGVSGTLPVGNGGTGATTITGLVKGNGASAMTAAVAGTDFVAPSGTINFGTTAVTINRASAALTLAGITLTSPTFSSIVNTGTLTLPTSTDTLVGRATTDTLTNKRINPRVVSVASSATPAINTDNGDVFNLTSLTTNVTSMTTSLTGTPIDGQRMTIRVKSAAAQTITWGASFVSSGAAMLPTTTVAGATHRLDFLWDAADSDWVCVGSFHKTYSSPPTSMGSGITVNRTATGLASLSTGENIFPLGWFRNVVRRTDDLTYDTSSTNTGKVTVSVEGWYQCTISCASGLASANSGVLYSILWTGSGAGARSVAFYGGQSRYNAAGGTAPSLNGSFIIYLKAGDYVEPGYHSNVAVSNTLGNATSAFTSKTTWFSVALINRSHS